MPYALPRAPDDRYQASLSRNAKDAPLPNLHSFSTYEIAVPRDFVKCIIPMIFTTCDASANSEAAIAKVTLVLPSPMSSMRIAGASLPTISKCGKLGIMRF